MRGFRVVSVNAPKEKQSLILNKNNKPLTRVETSTGEALVKKAIQKYAATKAQVGESINHLARLKHIYRFVEAHDSKKSRSDKGEPWKPDKERPDQLMVVKFKAQQLVRRDGSLAPAPRLIDARKQPWSGVAIGNGSRLVIADVIHAWDRPEGVGITLIPRAAQVVHYVPYQESDPTQGFQEQEGYSQGERLVFSRPECTGAASSPTAIHQFSTTWSASTVR